MTFKASVAAFKGGKVALSADATLSARIKLSTHVSPRPACSKFGESLRSRSVVRVPALLTTKNLVRLGKLMGRNSESIGDYLLCH